MQQNNQIYAVQEAASKTCSLELIHLLLNLCMNQVKTYEHGKENDIIPLAVSEKQLNSVCLSKYQQRSVLSKSVFLLNIDTVQKNPETSETLGNSLELPPIAFIFGRRQMRHNTALHRQRTAKWI